MTHTIYLTLALLVAMAIYLAPALIADDRKRPDTLTLAVFNFALGWTVIGWAITLYWALQPVKQTDVAKLAATTRHDKTEALFAAIGQRARQRGARRAGLGRQSTNVEA